jgi:hypothetical protein
LRIGPLPQFGHLREKRGPELAVGLFGGGIAHRAAFHSVGANMEKVRAGWKVTACPCGAMSQISRRAMQKNRAPATEDRSDPVSPCRNGPDAGAFQEF